MRRPDRSRGRAMSTKMKYCIRVLLTSTAWLLLALIAAGCGG